MQAPTQLHMPRRRNGHTTAVTIGQDRFYLTANGREDGTLGEVFIQWGKQGTSQSGLMDIFAIALSVNLQHGVPLTELVTSGLGLNFAPHGHTDDPEIPRCRSVVDYFSRRLAIDWLPYEERAELGVFTISELVEQAGLAGEGPEEAGLAAVGGSADFLATGDSERRMLWELATSVGAAQ